MKFLKKEEGFTLIELMLTIAIVGIITVAVYNAYFGSVRAWNYNKNRLEVQRAQDLTHRWISKYAKQANFINPNYLDNKDNQDGDKLYLEYLDQDGNLKKVAFGRENSDQDYLYFYDLDSGTKRKIGDFKLSSLSFDYSNDLIKMEAEIFNEENSNYKFSSSFNPRLNEITTP